MKTWVVRCCSFLVAEDGCGGRVRESFSVGAVVAHAGGGAVAVAVVLLLPLLGCLDWIDGCFKTCLHVRMLLCCLCTSLVAVSCLCRSRC